MWLRDLLISEWLITPRELISIAQAEALGEAIAKLAEMHQVYSVPQLSYTRFHYLKRGAKPFQKADLMKLAKAHNLTPELYWQALARQLKDTDGDR